MPEATNRPLKVFLCHTSADKPVVREFYRQLHAEDWIDAWLDEVKLLPGQEWDMEIEKAVEEADVVIVCISTHSVDKEGYVQKELRYVLNIADEKPEGSIFVIPLRLDNCIVPRRLRHWQWVDYFPDEQKQFAYQRLLQSLRHRAARLGISFVKSGPSLHYMTSEEPATVRNAVAPNELEPIDSPIKDPEEKNIEKPVVKQTYTAAPKEVFSNINLRLIGSIAGGLLIISLLVWGGSKLFRNLPVATPTSTNAFQTNTTFTPQLPTNPSQPEPTATLSLTETAIPPAPTLGIGSTMIGKDGMTLLYVPAGEFTMGSENEKPASKVNLSAFWIDETEVTNKQYAICVSTGDCVLPLSLKSPRRQSGNYYGNPQFEDYPVVYINWFMAKAYCEWAGRRLPTEAEWEKAARGTDGRVYPWGNEAPNDNLLNYNTHWKDTTFVRQYPVGRSPYGAYDMAGNVWEWTSSLYLPYPYDASDAREDLSVNEDRVLRGGSWYFEKDSFISIFRYGVISVDLLVRSDIRSWTDPLVSSVHTIARYGAGTIGIRCAMSATP